MSLTNYHFICSLGKEILFRRMEKRTNHEKCVTIGIEDQLKKSKFLGRLPLHCLPFDFL